jgi:hypothetical protein
VACSEQVPGEVLEAMLLAMLLAVLARMGLATPPVSAQVPAEVGAS